MNTTTQVPPAPADILTKAEAAAYLKIKIRTLDDWRAARAIPCIERGRYIRFRRADLDAFLTAHTTQPGTSAPLRRRAVRSATATTA